MSRRKGIDYDDVKQVANEVSKVSKSLGITNKLAQMIVSSQFDFIRYIIERGDFETVRFPYIGKFEVSPKRLFYVNNKDGITEDRKWTGSARQRSSSDSEGVQEDTDQGQRQE